MLHYQVRAIGRVKKPAYMPFQPGKLACELKQNTSSKSRSGRHSAHLSGIPSSLLSYSLVVQGLDGGFIQTFQLFRLNGYLHITWVLLPQDV